MLSVVDRVVGVQIHKNLVMLGLVLGMTMPARSDAWGIEIPANFGKWFLAIKDWYVQNQALIAKGRQLYVQYNRVRSTYDLLQGLADPEFREHWSENLQTLAVANAAFFVQDELLDGEFRAFFEQLLGIQDGGMVVPSAMKVFSLEVIRNRSFIQSLVPENLPLNKLLPVEVWHRYTGEVMASNRYHRDYAKLRVDAAEAFYTEFVNQSFDDLVAHEMSPMSRLPRERIFSLLFDLGDPFHAETPIDGEVTYDEGGRLLHYDAFLKRRILSGIWLRLGTFLRTKLQDIEAWLQERALQIRSAAWETKRLVDQINDLYFGFRNLSGAGGNAGGFATALSLAAGGSSDEVAEGESRTQGYIKAKLDAVVQRAESVASQIDFAIGEIRKIRQLMPASGRHPRAFSLPRIGHGDGKPLGWSLNQNQVLRAYLDREAL